MPRFRKKPVEIEAYQLTKELVLEHLINRAPLPGLSLRSASHHPERRELYNATFVCVTIHGQETSVAVDDWVITEPDGIHHYPCKPDIFAASYDPA
jgi:hypothetical protein